MSLPESQRELEERQRRLLKERRIAKEALSALETQGRQIGYLFIKQAVPRDEFPEQKTAKCHSFGVWSDASLVWRARKPAKSSVSSALSLQCEMSA